MKKFPVVSIAIALGVAVPAAAVPNGAAAPEVQPAAAAVANPSGERLDLARRFIAASGTADNMIGMMRVMYWQSASLMTEAQDEAQRATADAALDKLFVRLEPHVRQMMPALLEQYAQVYAREFSADDLRELTAFVESPAGRRYMQRAVALEGDPLLLAAQTELWEKLTPVIQTVGKEMCAERAAIRVAAGDAKAKCPLAAGSETKAG